MEILDQPSAQSGQTVASDGNRIVAYLIDSVIVFVLALVPIVGWIAGLAYAVTRDGLPFLDGQSVGKKVMKLRAVTEDGQPLTNNWSPVIVRNIVLFIPFFAIIELVVMLNNPQKLRLGDQWAKTKVISVE
ncbi:MAG: RDD family protein [Saprospiraceae bacterium]|nr:RDD family protein [Saprospiraceae bacterium]